MGGLGSGTGYRSGRTTAEESKRIDIRYMRKRGFLTPMCRGSLNWTTGGEPSGDIRYTCFDNRLLLRYRISLYGGDWESVEQTVYFDSTRCNYGGERKWFLCTHCSRRVEVLYSGGKYFHCRRCYRIPYRSNNESYYDNLNSQQDKLGRRIFENYDYGDEWFKKKGMHWKTFNRLYEKYEQLGEQADMAACMRFARFLDI